MSRGCGLDAWGWGDGVVGGAAAHAHAHPHAAASTGTTAAALPAATFAARAALATATATAAGAGGTGGALHGNVEIGGDGREIEGLADEIAQGDDELVGVDLVSGDEFPGGLFGKAHMFVGAEQDDIGEGRLHRVAHLTDTLECFVAHGAGRNSLAAGLGSRLLGGADIAQMPGIDGKTPGEGAAEDFIGGDQRLEALIDLAVHPLLALLDGGHHDEANADADEREERDAD